MMSLLTPHARVPSTINRVYTLVRPESTVFGLDFASGLVLPLQGFWNTLVYIVTSFPACKALFRELTDTLFCRHAPRPDRMPPTLALSNFTNSKHNHRVLGSEDTRADIVVSLDGKRRIVHHTYRKSHDNGIAEEVVQPGPAYAPYAR